MNLSANGKADAIRRTARFFRRVMLHIALISGSFVFAAPFIWLLSTSAKMPDEMYPPRWLPPAPKTAASSPYIELRANEHAECPISVAAEDWERLKPPVLRAISERTVALRQELPAFYAPYLGHPDLAEGMLNRLVKRAPDEVFHLPEAEAQAWFAEHVDAALAREVFETAYRHMALAGVTFIGYDAANIERFTEGQPSFDWRGIEGSVKLISRPDGLLRPAIEAHYDFDQEDVFTMRAELPLRMQPNALRKCCASIHGDRSWHELEVMLEMGGRRYESTEPVYLSTDLWQDITWKFPDPNEDALRMKTWYDIRDAGISDYNTPGSVRMSITCHYRPFWVSIFNKFGYNYRQVLRMAPLYSYIRNSVFLVLMNVIGSILGSSLVAFAFARLQWPGRDFCFSLVLATIMIPAQVTMAPVFLIFKHMGWYNTLLPLWVPSFFGSAFAIFLLRQFMRSIPADLEDSAKIDGCGYVGIYWRIILPLIKPALATIGIFTFMGVWNDFMGPLIYLSDQELYPLSLGLFALQAFQMLNYGLLMAAAVLMTLPIIALFFAAQRQFIQGITLTGMKG